MTPNPPAERTPDEVRLKVDEQWFYRGNRSPSWFATYREGGGPSDRVEPHIWPILDALADSRAECERVKHELMIRTDNYQYQRERAERAEADAAQMREQISAEFAQLPPEPDVVRNMCREVTAALLGGDVSEILDYIDELRIRAIRARKLREQLSAARAALFGSFLTDSEDDDGRHVCTHCERTIDIARWTTAEHEPDCIITPIIEAAQAAGKE